MSAWTILQVSDARAPVHAGHVRHEEPFIGQPGGILQVLERRDAAVRVLQVNGGRCFVQRQIGPLDVRGIVFHQQNPSQASQDILRCGT